MKNLMAECREVSKSLKYDFYLWFIYHNCIKQIRALIKFKKSLGFWIRILELIKQFSYEMHLAYE